MDDIVRPGCGIVMLKFAKKFAGFIAKKVNIATKNNYGQQDKDKAVYNLYCLITEFGETPHKSTLQKSYKNNKIVVFIS